MEMNRCDARARCISVERNVKASGGSRAFGLLDRLQSNGVNQLELAQLIIMSTIVEILRRQDRGPSQTRYLYLQLIDLQVAHRQSGKPPSRAQVRATRLLWRLTTNTTPEKTTLHLHPLHIVVFASRSLPRHSSVPTNHQASSSALEHQKLTTM